MCVWICVHLYVYMYLYVCTIVQLPVFNPHDVVSWESTCAWHMCMYISWYARYMCMHAYIHTFMCSCMHKQLSIHHHCMRHIHLIIHLSTQTPEQLSSLHEKHTSHHTIEHTNTWAVIIIAWDTYISSRNWAHKNLSSYHHCMRHIHHFYNIDSQTTSVLW